MNVLNYIKNQQPTIIYMPTNISFKTVQTKVISRFIQPLIANHIFNQISSGLQINEYKIRKYN